MAKNRNIKEQKPSMKIIVLMVNGEDMNFTTDDYYHLRAFKQHTMRPTGYHSSVHLVRGVIAERYDDGLEPVPDYPVRLTALGEFVLETITPYFIDEIPF